jgi:hypothetical protein
MQLLNVSYGNHALQIEYCPARNLHSISGMDAEQLATTL